MGSKQHKATEHNAEQASKAVPGRQDSVSCSMGAGPIFWRDETAEVVVEVLVSVFGLLLFGEAVVVGTASAQTA